MSGGKTKFALSCELLVGFDLCKISSYSEADASKVARARLQEFMRHFCRVTRAKVFMAQAHVTEVKK